MAYTPTNMASIEIPKGLVNIIEQAKETPEYKRRVLEGQVVGLCDLIFKSDPFSEGYVPPVIRKIGKNTIALKISKKENLDSRITEETTLKLAIDVFNVMLDEGFMTVFTIGASGVKNMKSEQPTMEELTGYLETLKYFKNESDKDRKNQKKHN
jgi:hypothetical protein